MDGEIYDVGAGGWWINLEDMTEDDSCSTLQVYSRQGVTLESRADRGVVVRHEPRSPQFWMELAASDAGRPHLFP